MIVLILLAFVGMLTGIFLILGMTPFTFAEELDQAAFWAATADFQANPAGQPPQRAEGHP